MAKMEKIRGFVRKHKKGFIYAGVAVVGVIVGYELCDKIKIGDGLVLKDGCVAHAINDAADKYNNLVCAYSAVVDDAGITASELGRLGEGMLSSGVTDDYKFTHFVAICKNISN